MARPMIKAVGLSAALQTVEPTSKMLTLEAKLIWERRWCRARRREQGATVCEQEGRATPADVFERVEGFGDPRDRVGEDGSVLRDFVSIGLKEGRNENGSSHQRD